MLHRLITRLIEWGSEHRQVAYEVTTLHPDGSVTHGLVYPKGVSA